MVSTQVAGARKALKELKKKGYDAGILQCRKLPLLNLLETINQRTVTKCL